MTLSSTPGSIRKFARTPWKFQTTFNTPLKKLDSFVTAILADQGGYEKGIVTIDEVVFEPRNLKELLAANLLSTEFGHDWSIVAKGKTQVRELLEAAFSDWVDFSFVPTPKSFVIYADHDEFTTFFATTKSNLNQVVETLLNKGFERNPVYRREL